MCLESKIFLINKMERLSKDDLFTIAINLEVGDLLNFCESSDRINKLICEKDNIWLYHIKKRFP